MKNLIFGITLAAATIVVFSCGNSSKKAEAAAQAGIRVDVTVSHETPSMAGAIEQYLKKMRAEEEKEERKAAREAAKIEKARQLEAAKRSAAAKKAAATRKAKAEAAAKAPKK